MLQTIFGADILWRHRRLVVSALLPSLIYLSIADALAITAGTWTISPAQSLNIYLAGYLPIEEFIFFLITNVLVVFGMTLVLARESQARVPAVLRSQLTKIS
jgi:lycopene cyclase domain-containing protein